MIENKLKSIKLQKMMAAITVIPAALGMLNACKGSEGPAGPTGPAGPAGGGGGDALVSCTDVIAQNTCYVIPGDPTSNPPFDISIVCSATGTPGDQAFQICYYKDTTCTTPTGVAGFGYYFSPETAGGSVQFIPNTGTNALADVAGGTSARIVDNTASCS